MKTTKVRNTEQRNLAEYIALRLFTPGGSKTPVDHMQLYRGGNYVCGWSRRPMADFILTLLDESRVEIREIVRKPKKAVKK